MANRSPNDFTSTVKRYLRTTAVKEFESRFSEKAAELNRDSLLYLMSTHLPVELLEKRKCRKDIKDLSFLSASWIHRGISKMRDSGRFERLKNKPRNKWGDVDFLDTLYFQFLDAGYKLQSTKTLQRTLKSFAPPKAG